MSSGWFNTTIQSYFCNKQNYTKTFSYWARSIFLQVNGLSNVDIKALQEINLEQ